MGPFLTRYDGWRQERWSGVTCRKMGCLKFAGLRARTLMLAVVGVLACGDGAGPAPAPRTYLMGFSAIPPRLDSTADIIRAINNWAPHADAAIMHVSPPWAAMLGGHTPAGAVDTVELPLANYYRAKGLAIVFTVDATDGLNRAAQAPELVAAGRSITDTMIQRLYREWVFAVANKIRPDYLGLAAETNLIRQLAVGSRRARRCRCWSWREGGPRSRLAGTAVGQHTGEGRVSADLLRSRFERLPSSAARFDLAAVHASRAGRQRVACEAGAGGVGSRLPPTLSIFTVSSVV